MPAGLDAQLMVAEESAYGTFVTPTRGFELVSETLDYDRDRIESRGIRAGRRVLHRWAPGVARVAGDVVLELAAQGFGIWWKHILGGAAVSGVGPYTHTFTPGALNGKSLTVQVGKPDLTTVNPMSYVGVKITRAEIAATVNEYASLTLSMYGSAEDQGQALAAVSYPAGLSPFTFVHGSLTVAGVAVDVREATLIIDNGLAIDRHFLRTGGQVPKEPLEADRRTITGTLDADFTALTDYNRYVNGTEAALVLAFNAGASAQLTITMNTRFDGETPKVSGLELLDFALPFKAVSATSDAAAITAVLINGDAAP